MFRIHSMVEGLSVAKSLQTCQTYVSLATMPCSIFTDSRLVMTHRNVAPKPLGYLDVSKNDFSSPVPAEIGNLPVLEKFYAVDSGITGDLSFLEPMPAISKFDCLVHLCVLSDIRLHSFDTTLPLHLRFRT